MAEVHHSVHGVRGARRLKEGIVGGDGVLITFYGGGIIAGAQINVCGHVNEMSRSGNGGLEAPGAGVCEFRMRSGFDGMNVIVVCAGVIGPALQCGFESGNNFRRVFIWFAVNAPELPRMQIHQTFGEENLRVGVVRIFVRERAHRVRVIVREF